MPTSGSTSGTMVYRLESLLGKRVPVRFVFPDVLGERPGWYADDAMMPGARMFYPADMFDFEPA